MIVMESIGEPRSVSRKRNLRGFAGLEFPFGSMLQRCETV